jgi:quinol monooxygenase YgiN
MPIIVTGTIDLDPSRRDAAIEVFTKAMGATREEPGCEGYTFSADLEDPGRFHVREQWADGAAVATHLGSANLAELMGAMGPLGVTGASLTRWDGATGSALM